jgi:hypothetical protein
MVRNPAFATSFVTLYLVIYTILFQTGASSAVLTGMFAASPFLVIWMAITIMKYGKYSGRELEEQEEWGYQDINKNEL